MKRSFIREILEAINKDTISFAGGLPDAKLFPIKQLKKATSKITTDTNTWQYSTSNGLKELREKIAKRYTKDGFKTNAENILITTGSQQALYIIARCFENNNITIESPSYIGAMNSFKLNHLTLDSVKLRDNGIDKKGFEKSIKNSKLTYLIPDFQNPSGKTYSDKKRKQLSTIIKKNGAILIEDSPYSDIYFTKKHKSISSYIPNNSFHLGSFSKTLSPSLRIGYIRASEELISKLLIIKESIDLHSCGISQNILNEYLSKPKRLDKHLKTLQNSYKDKMEYFCDCLDEKLPQFKYTKPKGGMFIYGEFENIDVYKLLEKCMENNVVFVPADEFLIEGKNKRAIRFNYTNSSFKEIKKGITKISNIINTDQLRF